MIAWFANNHVAANILMAVMIVSGLVALRSVRREVFPPRDTFQIAVTVPYPGAAPEEIEEGICKRIENEIFGLEGVKRLTASATEGVGTVLVEVMRDFEPRELLDEVKTRVDAIDNFPEEARRPVVREVTLRRQAVTIAISGKASEASLKALAEKVRDDLADLPEITQVEIIAARPYEITIEVAEDALRRHGLTLGQVATAVRRASMDLPGGSVRTEGGEVLIRTVGQRYSGAQFAELPVLTRSDGSMVRVSDIGRVIDGFAESDQATRFDGEDAVQVQVFRVGNQDVVQVVEAARRYVDRMRSQLPDGIKLTLWNDETVILRSRIDLLTRNMLSGLVLVFAVLAVFLRLRLAFWVALGIPVSFLGCAALMPMLDISVNMISLFAFLMVLGIVVDDAIVVGESVHAHRHRIPDGIRAAIVGTKAVSVPVVFGVLTTMAAFTPMLNMSDNAAKLWRDIGLIVIFCLAFSLVESKLILPAHLSSMDFDREVRGWLPRLWDRIRKLFTGGLDRFVSGIYTPLLEASLRYRYVTLCAALAVFVLTITLATTGRIKSAYFPPMEGDNVVANLVLAQGTPIEETARKIALIDAAARRLKEELARESGDSEGPVLHILTSMGTQPYNVLRSQNSGGSDSSFSGSHLGEVNIQLIPAEQRSISTAEIRDRWSKMVGPIADVEELSFSTDLFGSGKDVNVQMSGTEIGDLRAAAEAIKDYLRGLSGVSEVSDSFRGGKREVKLHIKPAGEMLNLTLGDLATQVRHGFHGEEVQRIQRRGEDMRVMVRFPEADRRSLATLEEMRVRTPSGDEVPFHTVADAAYGRGFATISRSDRSRTISVTARVNARVISASEIVGDLQKTLLPNLLRRHSSLRGWSFEGDNRNRAETQQSLRSGYYVVLFLIYALLAIPFRSYLQPFLVMLAIPFGFVGAILGHWMLGLELSIMSMFGFVALTGVVINDNLVLIDYINTERRAGTPLMQAVRESGRARFRPILLTSLTTCASLTPLLLERSVQAMFLIPMGVSLAAGVLFATAVSLLLVPCTYLILEDLRERVVRVFRRA
ncbi:MAG: efflux RND transporter permease subunit [Planctomycetes bacterium]|nr:efflux RND transporter permease subunit [Planctomycetota bacterium]MCB9889565.1 efflux RND transporter permease subunit [Planctomycetota bacterium]